MTLPENPDGYAVDIPARTIHKRYAAHAVGLPRTRTLSGVAGYFGPPSSVKACEDCWPRPKARKGKRCAS